MSSAAGQRPDGIGKDILARSKRSARPNPAPLALLALLVAAALLGLLGGYPNPNFTADGADARLIVNTPRIIRNGEFYETRIAVVARRPIEKLTIAVTPELWREVTLDGAMPDASEQSFEQGVYRLEYGKLEAGRIFRLKLDFYLHPPLVGKTEGSIYVLDGDKTLVEQPISMWVLP
jgi:hypothetical protein